MRFVLVYVDAVQALLGTSGTVWQRATFPKTVTKEIPTILLLFPFECASLVSNANNTVAQPFQLPFFLQIEEEDRIVGYLR